MACGLVACGLLGRGLPDRRRPPDDGGEALGPVAAEVPGRRFAVGVPRAVTVAAVGRPPLGDGGDGLVAEGLTP